MSTTEKSIEAENLLNIRQRINTIDEHLLELLGERRQLSLNVAQNKIKILKPIRDRQRELELLNDLIEKGKKYQLNSDYVVKIFHLIVEDSVLLQQHYLQEQSNPEQRVHQIRVAYLGSQGSYSYLASQQFFQYKQADLIELSFKHFDEVIQAVENGLADYAVLPIENTTSGSINEVYDLLQHTWLSIIGELTIPIEHSILTAVDTSLEQIELLCSHPQPHQQCSQFLKAHSNIQLESHASTADAMIAVAQRKSPHIAAIGHAQSGKLYGLSSLKDNIANHKQNQTRFIVVSRKAIDVNPLVATKTSFIMSTDQKPGSLVDCLLVLRKHKINMTKLESRPILGNPWEEMFYIDVSANIESESMQEVLKELKPLTKTLSVLGCYPVESVIPVTVPLISTE